MGKKEKKTSSDETKRIKKSDLSKAGKKKSRTGTTKKTNGKKDKFKVKHPRAATVIRIILIVVALLIIIGVGALVGTFFGLFGDELKISAEDLVIKYENSTVYDADENELATLSGGTKRKIVSMSEMSDYLADAYVAIEDERFYSHSGVDIKRTAAATVTFITNGGSSSFGGSTITQQLVKNITTDDDSTGVSGVFRKVKEMAKAIQVEQYLTKDQILELYLNIIFVGGDDINGVALGAVYYFDKDVADLSLAECAFMAGINHSPNAYKPFADDEDGSMAEKINNRTLTVLDKMLELDFITEDEYNEAVAEVEAGLNFQNGDGANVTTDVSYLTEAAIEQIVDQLVEEKDMSEDMAELYLYSSGLKIYTTQDSEIQAIVEEELVKSDYVKAKSTGEKDDDGETIYKYAMPTMVVVDHTTGQVVAMATATGDTENRSATTKLGYMNWPTKLKKQTGSTMKPISVIAPGLQTGTITAATMYIDAPTTFAGMDKAMKNDGNTYSYAPMSMRTAITLSRNIPNAKAIMNIGVSVSMEYCEMMGIDNLNDEGVSLALGGLNEGTSPLKMAMAYATIANDGTYISPTFYTKVTDGDGNVILEPTQTETEVLSEQNAYVEKDILKSPVEDSGGTATYCKISGIDVAAKTGTTNESYDRWLCGFTPYYTATCWYGYEESTEVTGFSRNPAGSIWSNVMSTIHEDLDNATFEEPDGIVTATICTVTGKLAVDGQCGSTYQEIFVEGTVPDACDGHVTVTVCSESGLIATDACPTQEVRTYTSLPETEQNATKWTTDYTSTYVTAPTETCTIHVSSGDGGGGGDAAAATPAASSHTHTYQKTHTAATCTSPGKYVYSCTAGDSTYEETISSEPALGHNYVNGKCSRCGAADPSASSSSSSSGTADTSSGSSSGDSSSGSTGTSSGSSSGDSGSTSGSDSGDSGSSGGDSGSGSTETGAGSDS